MNLPTYQDIENLNFWTPPQPCSLMLSLFDKEGQKITVSMFPTDKGHEMLEKTEYTPPPYVHIPRMLYINEELIELNSPLEKDIVNILSNLIKDNRLGHPEGLTVVIAQEMITYFS